MDDIGGYEHLMRRGIDHFPPDIVKKLTVKRWYNDFFSEVQLDEMPVLSEYFRPQFDKLISSTMDDEECWKRLVALFGILHTRVNYVVLDLPDSWVKDRA